MSFQSDVKKWSEKALKRYRATAKTAVQEVVAEAQTPRGKSGRMPIKTGFLQHSLVAAIGNVPYGESKNPGNMAFTYDPSSVSATLLRWNPEKETFYAAYVAQYAIPMEYRYGFLRGAVENWDQHVAKAAKEAERRIR